MEWFKAPIFLDTAQKIKFSIKDFFQWMWPNPQETVDLATFTE